MKQTVEEAKEYCKENMPYTDKLHFVCETAFEAGAAWQSLQSPWISVEEWLPEDEQIVLCSSQIYGKVVLCWDELSQSWSYPETDEFYCDRV